MITEYVQKRSRGLAKECSTSCCNGGPKIKVGHRERQGDPAIPRGAGAGVRRVAEGGAHRGCYRGWLRSSVRRGSSSGWRHTSLISASVPGRRGNHRAAELRTPHAVLVVFERRSAQEAGGRVRAGVGPASCLPPSRLVAAATAVHACSGYFADDAQEAKVHLKAYEDAALGMYNGLASRWPATTGQEWHKKRLADGLVPAKRRRGPEIGRVRKAVGNERHETGNRDPHRCVAVAGPAGIGVPAAANPPAVFPRIWSETPMNTH